LYRTCQRQVALRIADGEVGRHDGVFVHDLADVGEEVIAALLLVRDGNDLDGVVEEVEAEGEGGVYFDSAPICR
jgi:hypothetical protein